MHRVAAPVSTTWSTFRSIILSEGSASPTQLFQILRVEEGFQQLHYIHEFITQTLKPPKEERSWVPSALSLVERLAGRISGRQLCTSGQTAPLTASELLLVCKVVAASQALGKKKMTRSCQEGQTKLHPVESPSTKRHERIILATSGQASTCNLIVVPQCMKHHSHDPPLSHIEQVRVLLRRMEKEIKTPTAYLIYYILL